MKFVESNPQPKEIGFRELRLETDEIIEAVNAGASYIVSRKSKPLFKIVPLEEEVWDTVIDFTELSPKGVDINAVLHVMDEMKQTKKYGRSSTKISC